MRTAELEILVDGLDHPEGVCWDAGRRVLWAGGEAGQIYRVEPEIRQVMLAGQAPGFVLGLAVDGVGRRARCASSDGSLCSFAGENVRRLASGLGFPNSPAFGRYGSVWLGDSGP